MFAFTGPSQPVCNSAGLQEYYKALEDTDEKVQLANHIYELVDRHSRRLDQELSKFKMELEADHAGITETLEKKRRLAQSANHTDKRHLGETFASLAKEIRESGSAASSPAHKMFSSSGGASASAIGNVAVGSPAVTKSSAQGGGTGHQGRRTAKNTVALDHVSKASGSAAGITHSAPATPEPVPRSQRTKKQTSKAAALMAAQQQQAAAAAAAAAAQAQPSTAQVAGGELDDMSGDIQVDEWNADPNEPRYCLCNQVSYGEMVGCDNNDCPIEWFHYGCVGLTQAPKGKWFCPQCTAAMKRRGRR
ncbi:inhibitor of growth protein [Elysia marginata]|uniref:Inhibitor of growth protein n=1 Tax=Elysia marginata TaxID=1093978 RepID=A0AAV4GH04_9GAST|nr:inhibitor of growth protein [Elysia marginata]